MKCLPLCLAILRGDEHGFDQAAQALAAASSSNSNFHRPRSPNVPNLAASTSRQSPSPNLAANTRSSKTQVLTPYSPAIPRSGRMENLYSLAARTNRSSFEEIGEGKKFFLLFLHPYTQSRTYIVGRGVTSTRKLRQKLHIFTC